MELIRFRVVLRSPAEGPSSTPNRPGADAERSDLQIAISESARMHSIDPLYYPAGKVPTKWFASRRESYYAEWIAKHDWLWNLQFLISVNISRAA